MTTTRERVSERAVPEQRPGITLPGVLLGIGLGGFVDGIVLHQILQWHHMLSNTDDNPTDTLLGLERNTVADGLFHAATWVALAIGVLLLWRLGRRGAIGWDDRSLLGWILAGWGGFNVVEGLVNHQILRIHHVREGVSGWELYDVGFLLLGAALLVVGVITGRSGHSRPPAGAQGFDGSRSGNGGVHAGR
jgi:uncharacterized membrane protein